MDAGEFVPVDELHTRPKSRPLFDRIRAHILEGLYPPGHWLKQIELETRYEANRSDVRSALSSLAEKGVVEYVKNRGFRVFDRSDREIREMSEVITFLERAAAPGIVANATPENLAELRALADAFAARIEIGAHAELRLLNFQFHSRLNRMCGNDFLAQTVQNLRECCIAGPFGRYTTYAGLRTSSAEHYEIVELVAGKDVEGLAARLAEHSAHTL